MYYLNIAADMISAKNYNQAFHFVLAALESRLSGLDDPSPLNWLSLAEDAYLGGEYRQAIAYYDKAIKLAPYLHNPYFGKAKSYFKMGKTVQAEQSLQLARQYSRKDEQSLLYERKLIALKTSRVSGHESN